MTQDKHTALPWYSIGMQDDKVFMSVKQEGTNSLICTLPPCDTDQPVIDSAFIVHACNNIERVEKERDEIRQRLEQRNRETRTITQERDALLEALKEARPFLETIREVEMEVVGCAMECCGNFTDGGECRSYCVVQGEPEYEPRLAHGPINELLSILDQQASVEGGKGA